MTILRGMVTLVASATLACGGSAGAGAASSDGSVRSDARVGDAGSRPSDGGRTRDGFVAPAVDAGPDSSDVGAAPPFSLFTCDGGRAPVPLPPCTGDVDAGSVVSIASGVAHTCALFAGGTVKCWGDNDEGELGIGGGFLPSSSVPVPVYGVCGAVAISAAQYQTCVVLRDGSVACWGNSPDGIANHDIPVTVDAGVDAQCSSDGMTGQVIMVGSTPGVVPCVSSAVMVAAGQATNCALISDGSIRCWGYGFTGALGNGNVDGPIEEQTGGMVGPVEVSNIHTAVAVSVTQSACALLADGTVECWGPNMSGELGNGTTERSYVPVLVQDLSNASAVAIGGPNGNHECETCVGYACAVLRTGPSSAGDRISTASWGTARPRSTPAPSLLRFRDSRGSSRLSPAAAMSSRC